MSHDPSEMILLYADLVLKRHFLLVLIQNAVNILYKFFFFFFLGFFDEQS